MKIVLLLISLLMAHVPVINDSGYSVGDKARNFTLKNVDGKMVSLSDYGSAKGFIIVFTCNACPFAKAYESRIMKLDQQYAAKGYPVIAIMPNDVEKQEEDSFENMKKRSEEKGYTFPYLIDETQKIAKSYGAKVTPHVYVLDKNGDELTVAYIGGIDNNARDASKVDEKYVEQAVDALLKGKEIPEKETRAVGCSIKWKNS